MIDMISLTPTGRQLQEPRVALVTAREALELDEDMPLLVEALQRAGATVETPYWDDPAVDWTRYGVALLRSTWDYADRIEEFLGWCDRCAARTRLLNHPQVVRWNTDKHYLADLALAGVPVVPTRFVEPGCDSRAELATFLRGDASSLTVGEPGSFDELVVKPAIGAGSRDAARYRGSEFERALEHVNRLLTSGRSLLLQPYLSRVDEQGETAVLYLGGAFSHSIRKGPLLRAGAAMVEGLFAPEEIRPRQADQSELEIAAAAYAAIPFAAPAYARIDLLRDARGMPVVLELELTEPSLFLTHAPRAAGPFARHLVERLGHFREPL
jgi:glutathione synthase/RimK-type ligase-like ATP-grasp enzyme